MIPAWLTISAVRKFGPWVLGILLLIALYLWIDHRGYARAQAKNAATIASWQTAFHASDANFRVAIGAVNQQNIAIKGLAADGEARAREAAQARDAALKANASLVAQAKTLSDVAKRHYSSAEPCSTPAEVLSAKEL